MKIVNCQGQACIGVCMTTMYRQSRMQQTAKRADWLEY